MNPTALGLGQRPATKKSLFALVFLAIFIAIVDSRGAGHRSDRPQQSRNTSNGHVPFRHRYDDAFHPLPFRSLLLDTQRQHLSQIPSLQQLLASATSPSNEQQAHADSQLTPRDCDDPLVHHLMRYSELMSNSLEAKPITEKMDHWYLDLKKNLMVLPISRRRTFTQLLSVCRRNSTSCDCSFSKRLNKTRCAKNKRKFRLHPRTQRLTRFFARCSAKRRNTSA